MGIFPTSLAVGATTTAKEHLSSNTVPLTTKHYGENLLQLSCFCRGNLKHLRKRQESRTQFCLLLLPCCLETFCQFFRRYIHHQPRGSAEYFVGLKKKKVPHDSHRHSNPFLFLISKALLSGKQKVNFLELAQADLM